MYACRMEEKRRSATSNASDKFIVRLPDGMRDKIAEAARSNSRTMNAEVVARLQTTFQEYHAGSKLGREGVLLMLGSVLRHMTRALLAVAPKLRAADREPMARSLALARSLQSHDSTDLEARILDLFPTAAASSVNVMASVLRDAALATDMNSAVINAERGNQSSPSEAEASTRFSRGADDRGGVTIGGFQGHGSSGTPEPSPQRPAKKATRKKP
jgi:hypothetical protein